MHPHTYASHSHAPLLSTTPLSSHDSGRHSRHDGTGDNNSSSSGGGNNAVAATTAAVAAAHAHVHDNVQATRQAHNTTDDNNSNGKCECEQQQQQQQQHTLTMAEALTLSTTQQQVQQAQQQQQQHDHHTASAPVSNYSSSGGSTKYSHSYGSSNSMSNSITLVTPNNTLLAVSCTHSYSNGRRVSDASHNNNNNNNEDNNNNNNNNTVCVRGSDAECRVSGEDEDSDAMVGSKQADVTAMVRAEAQLHAALSNFHFGLAAYVYGDMLGFGIQPSLYDWLPIAPPPYPPATITATPTAAASAAPAPRGAATATTTRMTRTGLLAITPSTLTTSTTVIASTPSLPTMTRATPTSTAATAVVRAEAAVSNKRPPQPPPLLHTLSLGGSDAYMEESWLAWVLDTPMVGNNNNGSAHKPNNNNNNGGDGDGRDEQLHTSLTAMRSADYAHDDHLRECDVVTCSSTSMTLFPHLAPPPATTATTSAATAGATRAAAVPAVTAAAAAAAAGVNAPTPTPPLLPHSAASSSHVGRRQLLAYMKGEYAQMSLSRLQASRAAGGRASAALLPGSAHRQPSPQPQTPQLQLSVGDTSTSACEAAAAASSSLAMAAGAATVHRDDTEQQEQQREQQRLQREQAVAAARRRATEQRKERVRAYVERRRKEREAEAAAAAAAAAAASSDQDSASVTTRRQRGVVVSSSGRGHTHAQRCHDAAVAARCTPSLSQLTTTTTRVTSAAARLPTSSNNRTDKAVNNNNSTTVVIMPVVPPLPPLLQPRSHEQQRQLNTTARVTPSPPQLLLPLPHSPLPCVPRHDAAQATVTAAATTATMAASRATPVGATDVAVTASAAAEDGDVPANNAVTHVVMQPPLQQQQQRQQSLPHQSAQLVLAASHSSSSNSGGGSDDKDDSNNTNNKSTRAGGNGQQQQQQLLLRQQRRYRSGGAVSLPGAAPIGANGPAWPSVATAGQLLRLHTPQRFDSAAVATTAAPLPPPPPPQTAPLLLLAAHEQGDTGIDGRDAGAGDGVVSSNNNDHNDNDNNNNNKDSNDDIGKSSPGSAAATAAAAAADADAVTLSAVNRTDDTVSHDTDVASCQVTHSSMVLPLPSSSSSSSFATRVRTLVVLDGRCAETSNVTHDKELVIVTGDDDFDEYNVDEVLEMSMTPDHDKQQQAQEQQQQPQQQPQQQAHDEKANDADEAVSSPLSSPPRSPPPLSSLLLDEVCRTLLRGCNAALLASHSAHVESCARQLLCQLVRRLFAGLTSCHCDNHSNNSNSNRRQDSDESSNRDCATRGNDWPCSCRRRRSYGVRVSFVWLCGSTVVDLLAHVPTAQKLVIAVSPIFGACVDGVHYCAVADAQAFEALLTRALLRASQLMPVVTPSEGGGFVYCSLVLKQRLVRLLATAASPPPAAAAAAVVGASTGGDVADVTAMATAVSDSRRHDSAQSLSQPQQPTCTTTTAMMATMATPPAVTPRLSSPPIRATTNTATTSDGNAIRGSGATQQLHVSNNNNSNSISTSSNGSNDVDVYVCSLTASLVACNTAVALYAGVLDHSPHLPRALFHYALGGPCYTVALVCIGAEETCAQAMLDVQQRMGEVCNRPTYPGSVLQFIAGVRGDLAPTLRAQAQLQVDAQQQQQQQQQTQQQALARAEGSSEHSAWAAVHEALQQQLLAMAQDAEALLSDFEHTEAKAYLHTSVQQQQQQQELSCTSTHAALAATNAASTPTSVATIAAAAAQVGSVTAATRSGAQHAGTLEHDETTMSSVASASSRRRVRALVCVEQHDTPSSRTRACGDKDDKDDIMLLVHGRTLTLTRALGTAAAAEATHASAMCAHRDRRVDDGGDMHTDGNEYVATSDAASTRDVASTGVLVVDEVVTRKATHRHASHVRTDGEGESKLECDDDDDDDEDVNATMAESTQPLRSSVLDELVAHFVAGHDTGLVSMESSYCAVTPLALRSVAAGVLRAMKRRATHATAKTTDDAETDGAGADEQPPQQQRATRCKVSDSLDDQTDSQQASHNTTALATVTAAAACAGRVTSTTSSTRDAVAAAADGELRVSIALIGNDTTASSSDDNKNNSSNDSNTIADLLMPVPRTWSGEQVTSAQAADAPLTTTPAGMAHEPRLLLPTPPLPSQQQQQAQQYGRQQAVVLQYSPMTGARVRGTTTRRVHDTDGFDSLLAMAIDRADPQLQLADPGILVVVFTLQQRGRTRHARDVHVSSLVCVTVFDVVEHVTRAIARVPSEALSLFDYLLGTSTQTVALLGVCDRDADTTHLLTVLQSLTLCKSTSDSESTHQQGRTNAHTAPQAGTTAPNTTAHSQGATNATPKQTPGQGQIRCTQPLLQQLQNALPQGAVPIGTDMKDMTRGSDARTSNT